MNTSASGPEVRPVVLLVEDHADTRDMYAWTLESSGFEVFTAASADAAFDLATSVRPDVLVTDFVLGGGRTGADLCNQLKTDVRTRGILTLMVTGSTERALAQESVGSACGFVRLKPYLPDALERDVRLLLRGETGALEAQH